jgi:DNA-3-methyladenine glycosylase
MIEFMPFPALPHEFYARDPETVARELLGKRLIRESPEGIAAGRIVEAEAYLSSGDPACHAHRGPTKKNATMFGPAGRAYVYMIHARWCLNAVTERVGLGSAVLIRAIEPLASIELMEARRGTVKRRDLARGPARLCQSLAITREYDGWDLTLGRTLWIAADPELDDTGLAVFRSPRIGVTSAHRRLLRFFVAGSPYVSGRASYLPVRRCRTSP